MSDRRQFFYCYSRAMFIAALAFGTIHGVQSLIVAFYNSRSLRFDPTGLLVLVPVEIMDSLVFLIVGLIFAYIPSRIAERVLSERHSKHLSVHVVSGALIGIFFLPLCASVLFFIFPPPDGPSYLVRCAEFGLPMIIAGVLGGYTFWRLARSNSELLAEQFS
jgi:hypothetical protein